jgi:SPP1 gp7 family putative phage head morphogenesis protein
MISRDSGNIELIKSLPVILGGGISSGASIQKMSQAIRERFDVSRYEAFRLLRTETNYFFNQAQLQTYIDNGVEEYEIVATLDGRTSDICMREDGKIYKSEEAIVGENYPPYHPNCRTVTRTIYLREIKMIGEQKFNARVERLGEEVNAEEERRKVMEEVIIQTRQSLTDNGVTDTIN